MFRKLDRRPTKVSVSSDRRETTHGRVYNNSGLSTLTASYN